MRSRCRRGRALAVVLVGLCPVVAGPAGGSPGAVDPGFGSGGVVQTNVTIRDAALDLLVQPDGKSITIGMAEGGGAVVRHRVDGTLDPSFGGGGGIVRNSPPSATLHAGVLQADGRIVVVGTDASFEDMVVVRYLATGAPDPAFGVGGIVQTDFGSVDQAFAVALQADGRIVVAGRMGDSIGVARYLTNGMPDPAFGMGGKVRTFAPAGTFIEASSVDILSTGAIVVGGRTGPLGSGDASMLLFRYTPAGVVDVTFGVGGLVAPANKRLAAVSSLVVQPGDRVVVAGAAGPGFAARPGVARYLSDGSLDATFGTGGSTVAAFESFSAFDDLTIDTSGRLLAVGSMVSSGDGGEVGVNVAAVSRFSVDGALDPTFGCAGSTRLEVAAALGGRATGVGTAAPDGRILVAGTALVGPTLDLPFRSDLLLVRLLAAGPTDAGYWVTRADGGLSAFGTAGGCGSLRGLPLNVPVVGHAARPSGDGYWFVAGDGGVFTRGDAPFLGSAGGLPLARPMVGMARTPSGNGYWLVAGDGGIFAFGDARFFGSTGGLRLNQPVVGMASTPSGNGYWLVASDGGIFAFGDARYFGSTGGLRLNQPVVGMASTPSGNGYWLVASDGGIFAFGGAGFSGSTGSIRLNRPIVGMTRTSSGSGYWLAGADGGIFAFNAPFLGSTGGQPFTAPAVAIT